jgi:hypothetical protein
LKYSGGKFKSVKHLRGKLTPIQHEKLMVLCPQLEADVYSAQKKHEGRVTYTMQDNNATIYTQLMDAYNEWYYEQLGIPPKIDGVSGKAMKSIVSYLASQCANEQEMVLMWDILLSNWNNYDKFYQNQRELRQINSNFNILIAQIKHGKSTGNTQNKRAASNASHDFRESI